MFEYKQSAQITQRWVMREAVQTFTLNCHKIHAHFLVLARRSFSAPLDIHFSHYHYMCYFRSFRPQLPTVFALLLYRVESKMYIFIPCGHGLRTNETMMPVSISNLMPFFSSIYWKNFPLSSFGIEFEYFLQERSHAWQVRNCTSSCLQRTLVRSREHIKEIEKKKRKTHLKQNFIFIILFSEIPRTKPPSAAPRHVNLIRFSCGVNANLC